MMRADCYYESTGCDCDGACENKPKSVVWMSEPDSELGRLYHLVWNEVEQVYEVGEPMEFIDANEEGG